MAETPTEVPEQTPPPPTEAPPPTLPQPLADPPPTGRLNDDENDPTRGKAGAMPTDVQGDEVDPGAG